jgi:hypothetical protein
VNDRVAILGCGPAGLLCAWAVEQAGLDVDILSAKTKSKIPGSQHLHGPVQGLTSPYPEGTIQFVRLGSARGYAQKVYGDPDRETGWDNYLQVYPSWNVIKAYDRLWDHFYDRIIDTVITPEQLDEITGVYDTGAIISTLPAQAICYRPQVHMFNGKPYYIKTLPTPEADRHHEIVVYNGLLTDPWYRWSILGGLCSIESTKPFADTGAEVIVGSKAIDNDCDCWAGAVHRCGRWAEWRHGVTMYKAYLKAQEIATQIVRERL